MADQDFQIRISTTADLAGVKATQAELDQLGAKAKSVSVTVPSTGFPTPGQVAPIPSAAAATTGETEALARAAAIESQLQVIAQTRLASVAAQAAGNEALASQLQRELGIRVATLGVMRTEALTEADLNTLTENEARLLGLVATEAKAGATAIQLQGLQLGRAQAEALVAARQFAATGEVNTRTLGGLFGALGTTITISAVAGYEFYKIIASVAEQQLKVNQEIDQQTDKLGKSANAWREAAKAATTPEEVRGLADKIIPEIDAVSEKLSQVQQQSISGWEAALEKLANIVPFQKGGTPFTKNLEDSVKAQEQLARATADTARVNIKSAEDSEKAWGKVKQEPLSQSFGELSSKLESLKSHQDAVDLSTIGGIQQWAAYGRQIADVEKQLNAVIKIEQLRQEFGQANLGNLEKKGQLDYLKDDLARIRAELKALGVDANTAAEAFAAGQKLTGPVATEVQKLAIAWANTTGKIREQKIALDDLLADQRETLAIEEAKALKLDDLARKLEIERNYQKEIRDLIKQQVPPDQATAIAQARRAAAVTAGQFQAFQAGGGTPAGAIQAARDAALKEQQQRYVFDKYRQDVQARAARGEGVSPEELRAAGTPEQQPPPTPPLSTAPTGGEGLTTGQVQGAREAPSELPPPISGAGIDQEQLRATREYEKSLPPATPETQPKPEELKPEQRPPAPSQPPVDLSPAAEKLLTSGSKLDTAGDKLGAAADKLGGTKPPAAAPAPAGTTAAPTETLPPATPSAVPPPTPPAPPAPAPINVPTNEAVQPTAPPGLPPASPVVSAEPIPYVQPPTVSAEPTPYVQPPSVISAAEAPATKPPGPAEAPPTKPPAPAQAPPTIPPAPVEADVSPAPKIASSEDDSGIPNDPFRKYFGGGVPTPTPTPTPTPQKVAQAQAPPTSPPPKAPPPGTLTPEELRKLPPSPGAYAGVGGTPETEGLRTGPVQGAEYRPELPAPGIDQRQLAETREYEKTLPPAAPGGLDQAPAEQPPAQPEPGKPAAADHSEKLASAADKLSSAADKLSGKSDDKKTGETGDKELSSTLKELSSTLKQQSTVLTRLEASFA